MPTLRPRKPRAEASSSHPTVDTPGSSASSYSSSTSELKKRSSRSAAKQRQEPLTDDDNNNHSNEMSLTDEETPLLENEPAVLPPSSPAEVSETTHKNLSWAQRNQWLVFALASGACAAFNGVFAKLTTTELTAKFSLAIARLLGLEHVENVVEILVRGAFFGLNLTFNGVMWTLFTAALARGNSTTQVSILNTSTNFVFTAILGLAIFSEALPPLWWLGAAMLVAGNVIVGRKDEGVPKEEGAGGEEAVALGSGVGGDIRVDEAVVREGYKDEDVPDLGTLDR